MNHDVGDKLADNIAYNTKICLPRPTLSVVCQAIIGARVTQSEAAFIPTQDQHLLPHMTSIADLCCKFPHTKTSG